MPKHAPKGKIKGEAEVTQIVSHPSTGVPIEQRRCIAKSSRTGHPCKRWAIMGGRVCPMHGGSAPQVQFKAQERLMALQQPAVETMEYLMGQRSTFPSTAYAAARDVLDRTEGKAVETIRQEFTVGKIKDLGDQDLAVYAAALLARVQKA